MAVVVVFLGPKAELGGCNTHLQYLRLYLHLDVVVEKSWKKRPSFCFKKVFLFWGGLVYIVIIVQDRL